MPTKSPDHSQRGRGLLQMAVAAVIGALIAGAVVACVIAAAGKGGEL